MLVFVASLSLGTGLFALVLFRLFDARAVRRKAAEPLLDAEFERRCRRGEEADLALRSGRLEEAIAGYREIIDGMAARKDVDAFLMGKSVLGLMLALVKKHDPESASEIWRSDSTQDRIEAIGILALTEGQTPVRDRAIYYMLSAYFHGMSAAEGSSAADAIDDYMGRVVEYAQAWDRTLLPMAIHNWVFCLTHLHFPAPVPLERLAKASEHARRAGEALPDVPVTEERDGQGSLSARIAHIRAEFPDPAPWRVDWTDGHECTMTISPDAE